MDTDVHALNARCVTRLSFSVSVALVKSRNVLCVAATEQQN